MMSGIYTGIMLLWFWGSSKKKRFYGRKTLKLHQFLALMGDDGKDEQTSMTIAAQKIALKSSSTKLKRVRGAFPPPARPLVFSVRAGIAYRKLLNRQWEIIIKDLDGLTVSKKKERVLTCSWPPNFA